MADFKTTCRGPNCGREITMGTLLDGKPHPYDEWKRCPNGGWRCDECGKSSLHEMEMRR